jgi:peptidyl-prolyl cis-trans isomerase SurA
VFIRQLKNRIKTYKTSFSLANYGQVIALSLLLLIFNPIKIFAHNIPSSNVFVIAKVSNRAITNIDLINRYNLVINRSRIKSTTKQERQIILNQILQKMIDEELQIKEADNLHISTDQNQINQSIAQITKDWGKNPKQIQSFFSNNSLSYDNFLRQAQAQLLWSEIVKQVIAPKIKINQFDIDELLELRKINANIQKFFLSEIFIPNDYKNLEDSLDSKNLAFKISNELKNGGNFNDFVKQFSRSPTAEFNGEIGWVGNGDIDPKIYQEVSKTKIANTTNPVLMPDGYYLFKVNDKKSFNSLTNEDLEQVKNIIFNKKLQLLAKGYLMNLRKNAYVEIDRKAILEM